MKIRDLNGNLKDEDDIKKAAELELDLSDYEVFKDYTLTAIRGEYDETDDKNELILEAVDRVYAGESAIDIIEDMRERGVLNV
jgi:hypothetical protein